VDHCDEGAQLPGKEFKMEFFANIHFHPTFLWQKKNTKLMAINSPLLIGSAIFFVLGLVGAIFVPGPDKP
jgi:hypothetical protein